MKRLLVFSAIAIVIAWMELDLPRALGIFLFFAVGFGILRFVASVLLNEKDTWIAWCERITQVVILEVALFVFCTIYDFLMPASEWLNDGARMFLFVLEALPPLIFLFLAWGVVKVKFAKRQRPSAAIAECPS